MALDRAVMAYDDAIANAEARQLLVNIARSQYHQPIHFTRVSNIAATFSFGANAGMTPALAGDAGRALLPILGGSVLENPTFSIEPIDGEEFMKRLMTPFHQSKLTLLLRQRFDVDLVLRMMAQEVHLWDMRRVEDSQRIYHNSPLDRESYEMFRRVVLHLSAIQDQKKLYVEPMRYERSWTIPASAFSWESLAAMEKEFTTELHYNPQEETYTLNKRLLGPVLITNYDPVLLCCEQQAEIQRLINPANESDVVFDIRPEYPGGEWPMNGVFRLRSFHSILNFLSHALGEESEYPVEPDPRTPPVHRDENPVNTLGLTMSDTVPPRNRLSARAFGRYYAVDSAGKDAHWNMNAFQLLYILYRMTVTDVTGAGPGITIAK